MKKTFVLLFVVLCTLPHAHGQTLWEKVLPFELDNFPTVMFEDTTDHSAYISGVFFHAGSTPCNMIKWDGGSNFTMLPPSPLYNTFCITKYNGKIYAGGYGLARWDGNSWEYLDSNAYVACFYHFQNKLVVGGTFSSINGANYNKVAVWNDTAWSSFYGVDTALANFGIVATINEYKGKPYVGGNLLGAADTSIYDLAMFDGTKWTNVGGQLVNNSLSHIKKLLVWRDTLYVAGDYNESWGCPGNGIASWDGQNWHRLGKGVLGGTEPAIIDLAIYNNALYGIGSFTVVDGINLNYYGTGYKNIAKWDGLKWCTLHTVGDGGFGYLATYKDTLYGIGGFYTLNNDSIQFIAKWIGGNYSDSCSLGKAGISETAQTTNTFEVYPNPAQEYINVKTTLRSTNVIFSLCDLTGKMLMQQSIADDTKIPINKLPPGLYIYRVTAEGDLQKTGKILKQ